MGATGGRRVYGDAECFRLGAEFSGILTSRRLPRRLNALQDLTLDMRQAEASPVIAATGGQSMNRRLMVASLIAIGFLLVVGFASAQARNSSRATTTSLGKVETSRSKNCWLPSVLVTTRVAAGESGMVAIGVARKGTCALRRDRPWHPACRSVPRQPRRNLRRLAMVGDSECALVGLAGSGELLVRQEEGGIEIQDRGAGCGIKKQER